MYHQSAGSMLKLPAIGIHRKLKSKLPRNKTLLEAANFDLRIALVMFRANVTSETAENALKETNFVVEKAVEKVKN